MEGWNGWLGKTKAVVSVVVGETCDQGRAFRSPSGVSGTHLGLVPIPTSTTARAPKPHFVADDDSHARASDGFLPHPLKSNAPVDCVDSRELTRHVHPVHRT